MSTAEPAAPNAYRRKKEPERVRRALLDAATRLAMQQGFAAITVQGVAAAAGVTKGGLLHHFPNKDALIEAVFADRRAHFDHEIDTLMAADPEPRGRFTRAYVEATFAEFERVAGDPLGPICASFLMDPRLRRWWVDWLEARLERHRDTDSGEVLEIVRCAVDGIWFGYMLQVTAAGQDTCALRPKLVAMTRAP